MQQIKPNDYDEMIKELSDFKKDVEENVKKITQYAKTCLDNTENDENIITAKGQVDKCAKEVRSKLEIVDQLIKELKNQKEEAIRTRKLMQEDN